MPLDLHYSRRLFLKALIGLVIAPAPALARIAKSRAVVDRHSLLNACQVSEYRFVRSLQQARSAVGAIGRRPDGHLAVCGAMHAGGGQQFATGAPLIETRQFSKVLDLDETNGLITVQPGITWPKMLQWLAAAKSAWTFRQKQTGNDNLTIGGTLSANAHGQGLQFKPIIQDVESFQLLLPDGISKVCSRTENHELFGLVIGGYGNFGLITAVTLKLTKKLNYKRLAVLSTVAEIPKRYEEVVRKGAVYGDFQCSIDEASPGFLRDGIFSAYFPIEVGVPLSALTPMRDDQWVSLVQLAHQDKTAAFKVFSDRILATSGGVNSAEYWQSSRYVDGYHAIVDQRLMRAPGAEVLTETYVPLKDVLAFMEDVRKDALENEVNIIYSTIRFIERDDESFLPWARALSACVIFNIHTELDDQSRARTADICRRLIDYAIKYGGRYYLTYHRFATKEQVLACYPEFPEFLRLKRKYDPKRVFRSDWYLHYEKLFGE